MLVPIHRAGWPFVAVFSLVTLVAGYLAPPLFWIGLILTAWCAYFFRDPPRMTPQREGLVVSPADGRVTWVAKAKPPAELGLGEGELTRISIFLNVFDVHINRIPIGGKVSRREYHAGKFLNAALDKASEENERMSVLIDMADGRQMGVVQIAGLVARRIVCYLDEEQEVTTGARFGLIRFGSRTDLFLPDGVAPLVAVGQRAVGGETVLADLSSGEGPREAKER